MCINQFVTFGTMQLIPRCKIMFFKSQGDLDADNTLRESWHEAILSPLVKPDRGRVGGWLTLSFCKQLELGCSTQCGFHWVGVYSLSCRPFGTQEILSSNLPPLTCLAMKCRPSGLQPAKRAKECSPGRQPRVRVATKSRPLCRRLRPGARPSPVWARAGIFVWHTRRQHYRGSAGLQPANPCTKIIRL